VPVTIHNFLYFIFTFFNNNQHQNIPTFFTFYITSILFYYYSNKKIHYNTKLLHFSIQIFLLYITSSLFINFKINNQLLCSVQAFAKHTHYNKWGDSIKKMVLDLLSVRVQELMELEPLEVSPMTVLDGQHETVLCEFIKIMKRPLWILFKKNYHVSIYIFILNQRNRSREMDEDPLKFIVWTALIPNILGHGTHLPRIGGPCTLSHSSKVDLWLDLLNHY